MVNESSTYNDLSQQKLSLLFLRYALPAVIGTSVNTLYNIINGVFIGHWVGKEALSAIGLILPVMNLAAAIGMLVGVGSATRLSLCLGNHDKASAEKIVASSFLLTLILSSATLLSLLFFLKPVLYFVGASDITYPYARDFLEIFLPGSLFLTLTFNYNNMMRASGYPIKAMVTMFISVIANILLAPVFILGLGWGMRGAAIATTISMAISFVFVMQHFLSPKSTIRLLTHNLKLRLATVKSIVSIGMSPFCMQVAASAIVVFINWQLNHYAASEQLQGDDAIAAFANANRFITLIVMIVIGVNQGMQPIIGYNYGAKNYPRVQETFIFGVKIATIITSLGFLFGLLLPEQLSRAYSSVPDMVHLSAIALRYETLAFAFIGFQMVTTSFFQCIGKAKLAIILSLSRQVLILIPALYIVPLFIGLDGVWLASPIADLLASIMAGMVLYWYFNSIKRRHGLV